MMAIPPRGNATVAALGIALGLGATCTASAQSASAQAEAMFRDGRVLLDAGKIAEACAAFEASQKLEPATSTLMNLAACREKNGQLATAWGLFLDAEHQTRGAPDEATRRLHKVALDRANKLEPRVSKLTINVSAESRVDRLEIQRGAEVIDPAMWNCALPIDGGRYTITARAPGATAWTTEITLGTEADTKTVETPKLQSVAAAPVATSPDTHDARVHVDGPSDTGAHPGVSRPALATAGAGALLLIGAVAFDLWGNSSYRAARAELMDQAHRDSLYDAANTKRHVAEGMAVAGLACGGVAAWLYFAGRTATTATSAQMHVAPLVGGSGTGLVVLGEF